MIKKNFFCISCIIIFLIFFTGCEINNEEPKTIQDKTDEEISFIENKILTFFSMYAKGEYNEEEELNWELINSNIIELNNILDTIILDFKELEISNDEIIRFRDGINNLYIGASKKDIGICLNEYKNLYVLLPKYKSKYSENKNEILKFELKALVVSSFVNANLLDWENAKITIEEAEIKYNEMINDIDYMREYSYNLNKMYILVGELKSAIEIEELELTNLKYVNFIEKI